MKQPIQLLAVIIAISCISLLGCRTPKGEDSVEAGNCFDVIIPNVELHDATMAQAIGLLYGPWQASLAGGIPTIVWTEAPEKRVTMSAKGISAGRYLAVLASLTSRRLDVKADGVILESFPADVVDDYQTTLIDVSHKLQRTLRIGADTKAAEVKKTLSSYGIAVDILFVDAHQGVMVVRGFSNNIAALHGMRALLDAGITLSPPNPTEKQDKDRDKQEKKDGSGE